MEKLLECALDSEIPILSFYDMTVNEVVKSIEAYGKRKEQSIDYDRQKNYNLALLISLFVNNSLNGKQPPSYSSLYPSKEQIEFKQEKENAILKERLIAFAMSHNSQLGGE